MEKHYLVMWKDDSWGNWSTLIFQEPEAAQKHIGRLYDMCYDQIRLYTSEPSMVYNHIPERAIAQ